MEALIEEKQTLAQLTEPVKIFPQLLINVRVKDKTVVLDDADVKAAVEKVTSDLEGNGRALVRPSGTEPVIRVMVEAPTEELCHEHVLKVVNVIKEKGFAVEE